jgi:hypothetical protein
MALPVGLPPAGMMTEIPRLSLMLPFGGLWGLSIRLHKVLGLPARRLSVFLLLWPFLAFLLVY